MPLYYQLDDHIWLITLEADALHYTVMNRLQNLLTCKKHQQ